MDAEKIAADLVAERNTFADVFKHSPSFMAILRGPQHIFELVNDRYLQLIGNRDVIGKPVRQALPDIEGQGFFELLDHVYASGEPFIGRDVRIMLQRQADEPMEERYLEFVYQATRTPEGAISGIFVHGIDLTETKRAEQSHRELAEKLERQARIFDTALSSIADFTYIFDRSGRFLYVNQPLLKLWGLPLEEAVGKNFFDLHYPDELAAKLQRQIETVFETDQVLKDETEYVSPTGVVGYYEYIFSPVHAADGSVEVVAGSTREITSRKIAEQEREQLLSSERAARSEAERASRMKDDFLATLSHELRTPLNAIVGWSQILRSGGENIKAEDWAEGLGAIERNARAQTQIIEDLLDMSRIISGKVRLNVQPVDLVAVVQAGVDTLRPTADAKGVQLQAQLDAESVSSSGDASRLHQVFWNLISNAVKFTPRGGRVKVLLQRVESHVEISVVDSGEGIRPDFLPHVFDRFRQADASTTRRHGGLGLGLSIVKQLVELHGGSVAVRSAGAGLGTTFTVSLPVTAVQAEARFEAGHKSRNEPSVELQRDDGLQLQGVKVLLLDDEADARAVVRRLLEDCGASVRAASSPTEALELFQTERPDVIVSDIGMPGEDGYSFVRRLRNLGKEKGGNTPSLALTAYARPEDRVRAVREGFNMQVVKPIEPVELITMVASLVRRGEG